MVVGPSFKNMSIVEYTGAAPTPVRALLPKNRDVHGGVVSVIDMGSIDPTGGGAGDPVSAEKTVGVNVPEHTKILGMRAQIVNGVMGHIAGEVKLKAGQEAAYTTPALVNVNSAVALTEMSRDSLLNSLDVPTFDPTLEDYQFLKLQAECLATSNTWDPTKALDNIPYFLVDFGVCFEEKYAFLGPTGDAKSLYMNKTNTEVYAVYKGTLQAIGCLDNAVDLAMTVSQAVIKKGSTESPVDIAVGSRENIVSGKSYGFSPWLLNKMVKGVLTEGTDWITMSVDNGWKRIEGMEFFIQTHTRDGHDVVLWIPNGVIDIDGSIPLGSEAASMNFKINILKNFEVKVSKNCWDHIKLGVIANVL